MSNNDRLIALEQFMLADSDQMAVQSLRGGDGQLYVQLAQGGSDGRSQDVWIGQCAAARGIRNQHGIVSALDYLIGEKLMTYAEIAATRSEFARELPRFVAEVRGIFSKEEIAVISTSSSGCWLTGKRPRPRQLPRSLTKMILSIRRRVGPAAAASCRIEGAAVSDDAGDVVKELECPF